MTTTIDHFATTKGMIMGIGVGMALAAFLFRQTSVFAPEVAIRVVQHPEESCGPNESVIEITYPGNSTTYVVGHERLTLTSTAEISMSVSPVSKPSH